MPCPGGKSWIGANSRLEIVQLKAEQQDHADADRAPGVGQAPDMQREDEGDREIEGEDRRRHQEIAAAQPAISARGRAHAAGPTR